MASPNISEIASTTIEARSGMLADNVTKNNALLNRLSERGNVKTISGGDVILKELEYAENVTYTRYSGYDVVNVSPSDVFSAAQFNWKQCAVAVSISGLEQLQNSGKERIIDLLESRIMNAEHTFMNRMGEDVYSDGTASAGKQIGGLRLLVADAPTTGTVGGIDSAAFSFWRNFSFDATTDGGAAATSGNIQSYMNRTWIEIVRGTERPDLIVADDNYFRLYWESLQSIQRITDTRMGQAGFMTLKYMDADVVLDGGFGGFAPINHMYFLNTKYLYLTPHADRDFVPLGPEEGRWSLNQDAMVKLWAWAGNMCVTNRFMQGVLKD